MHAYVSIKSFMGAVQHGLAHTAVVPHCFVQALETPSFQCNLGYWSCTTRCGGPWVDDGELTPVAPPWQWGQQVQTPTPTPTPTPLPWGTASLQYAGPGTVRSFLLGFGLGEGVVPGATWALTVRNNLGDVLHWNPDSFSSLVQGKTWTVAVAGSTTAVDITWLGPGHVPNPTVLFLSGVIPIFEAAGTVTFEVSGATPGMYMQFAKASDMASSLPVAPLQPATAVDVVGPCVTWRPPLLFLPSSVTQWTVQSTVHPASFPTVTVPAYHPVTGSLQDPVRARVCGPVVCGGVRIGGPPLPTSGMPPSPAPT